jgi:hypothetical protein
MNVAATIAAAFLRSTHGKRYSKSPKAFELASEIRYARSTFPRESDSADLKQRERNQIRKRKGSMGQRLLEIAMRSAKELRLVADALEEEESEDPRQSNIIGAYLVFLRKRLIPTLAELREEFEERFGKESWTGDFSVRKTLKLLGLPLAPARRGRPRDPRSKIGNLRRIQQ